MKKIMILLLLAGTAFIGCKKDKGDSPTYTKAQLLGKWQQVVPDTYGEAVFMTFTDTELIQIDGTGDSELSLSYNYTFDGRVMTYSYMEIINMYLTINELTATKLVLTQTTSVSPGSQQFTYTKVP